MKLTLLAQDERTIRLACQGLITLSALAGQRNLLRDVVGAEGFGRTALLDLSGVQYIDSGGVSWLIVAHKTFQQAGGRLILHSLTTPVQRVFEIMHLGALLELADDEASACALTVPH
jgi:anti-anti-sigma factor